MKKALFFKHTTTVFLHERFVLSVLFILFFQNIVLGQEFNCEDFQEGTFFAESSNLEGLKWKVTRKGNQQLEELLELPKESEGANSVIKVLYEKVQWIDACTYRLEYDETKFELSESEKFINENGGVVNEITKIEGKCYYYLSTLTVGNKTQTMEGKICKE